MKHRSLVKPWRLYVLEKYKIIVEHENGYVLYMTPSQTNHLLKTKGTDNILVTYFEMRSLSHDIIEVGNQEIWSVYAVKQKRHHKNGSQEPRRYGQHCSACYVCGSQVGIAVDFDGEEIEYPWECTPVVKRNKCRNITNYRICCLQCHQSSANYDSLYDYAVSIGHSKRTSLAVRDQITTLTAAYKVYYHKYYY